MHAVIKRFQRELGADMKGRLVATPLPNSVQFNLPSNRRVPVASLRHVNWPEWQPSVAPIADSSCDTTRLNVYLNNNMELELNRKSSEPIRNTLKRMALNLSKKLANQQEQPVELSSTVLCDKQPIDDLDIPGCEIWKFATQRPHEIHLLDNLVQLDVWSYPPTIASVQAFETMESSLFYDVPVCLTVDMLYANRSEVEWYVDGICQFTTKRVHCFTPSRQDVGKRLSVLITPFLDAHRGISQAYQFTKTIESLPTNKVLEIRRDWIKSSKPIHSMRIVSYNILAQQNAFSTTNSESVYPYVSKEILIKARRLPLIVHELLAYDADVLCLQEVDESVFHGLLEPVLMAKRYEGYYTKKTTDQMEGCALFWKMDVFEKVYEDHRKSFEISRLFDSGDERWNMKEIQRLFSKRPHLEEAYSTLGHVFQIVPLKVRHSENRVWVVNTHLYFHPLADHIRLLQMYLLARQVEKETQAIPGDIVIAGDFNSSLQNAAGKLLLDRCIPKHFRRLNEHLNGLWTEENPRNDEFPEFRVPYSFPVFQSAVNPIPEFTHLIDAFKGNLDHILISSGLEPIRSAPMLSVEEATVDVAMPSEHLPSDHVSLVSDIRWSKR